MEFQRNRVGCNRPSCSYYLPVFIYYLVVHTNTIECSTIIRSTVEARYVVFSPATKIVERGGARAP